MLTVTVNVQALEVEVNKGLVGKALRGDAKLLAPYIESLDEAGKIALKQELESGQAKITAGGKELTLTPEMLTIKKVHPFPVFPVMVTSPF